MVGGFYKGFGVLFLVQLLRVVVCGGGPTGVEVAAELADFLKEDVPRCVPLIL